VVTGEPEAGIVAGYQVLHREPAVAARRAAVNNNQTYLSHTLLFFVHYSLGRKAVHAALHKEGGDDKGDERPDEFQGLSDFRSIQFHLFLTELMVNN
jgi:hypothetical protein